jgi:hypothetical protein
VIRQRTLSAIATKAVSMARSGYDWLFKRHDHLAFDAPDFSSPSSPPPSTKAPQFLLRSKYGPQFSLPLVSFQLDEPYNGNLLMHVGVGDLDNRPLIYGVPLSAARRDNVAAAFTDPSVRGDMEPFPPSPSGKGSYPAIQLLASPQKSSPLYKMEPLGHFAMNFDSIKVSLPDVYIFVIMRIGPYWIKTNIQKSSEPMRWSVDLPVYDPGVTFSMVLFYQKTKQASESDVFPYVSARLKSD